MQTLKGWKTVVFGLAVAVVPAGLTYLADLDWTHFVNPNIAALITGLITIALRAVTDTSIGTKT